MTALLLLAGWAAAQTPLDESRSALLASVEASRPPETSAPVALAIVKALGPRTWEAVQKTVMSDDPDMLMATLDVINALPESPKIEIAARLVEILEDSEDSEIEEKAVLALGVCGDHSEKTVNKLVGAFENKETDESVRIAAALVLGKQADSFPEKPRATLSKCVATSKSPSLKTACDLGLKELVAREAKTAASSSPRPVTSPNPSAAPRTPTESVAEGDRSEE